MSVNSALSTVAGACTTISGIAKEDEGQALDLILGVGLLASEYYTEVTYVYAQILVVRVPFPACGLQVSLTRRPRSKSTTT